MYWLPPVYTCIHARIHTHVFTLTNSYMGTHDSTTIFGSINIIYVHVCSHMKLNSSTGGQENKWNVLGLSAFQCGQSGEAMSSRGLDNTPGSCRNLSTAKKELCGSGVGEVCLTCKFEGKPLPGRD